MTGQPGRILVVRGGAIGDFILTLPVLAALRARLPRAHLTVLGYPHIAALALAGGLADEVHPIEARGLAGFFNARVEPPAELAGFFASFAVIVSYLYDPDGVFERNVRRCSRAIYVTGPHRPREDAGMHASQTFLKPLEQLAIFDADPCPRLRLGVGGLVSEGPGATGDRPGLPLGGGSSATLPTLTLAVHPGSGAERKNWPEACWAGLLGRLAARAGLRLLLVGGEAEGDRLDRLARIWPSDRLELARSRPLVEVARRLAACHAFAGHDSGITHLAAALGLPGLVLWGDTNEAVWRPRGDRVRLVRGPEGLVSIGVPGVEAGLLELLTGN